jgi:sugar-phosphatase
VKYSGFLFDLDGTLVNSLPAVERAWLDWGHQNDILPEDILSFIHGKQAITSLRHFMPGESEDVINKEFITLEKRESEDLEGVYALPGALDLLCKLNQLQIPWGVVTSGSDLVARARYTNVQLPMPSIFITANQVTRGKPSPDPYLLGVRKIGLSAEACIVVEDAPAGIISGLDANCAVVAVNAPESSSRLEETLFQISTLESICITKEGTNYFSIRVDP